MNTDRNTSERNGRVSRSSLACLPCRSRHLKCDAKKPRCTRCAEFARDCQYAQSRRGGLDRAALSERRKRLAEIEDHETGPGPIGIPSPQQSAGSQSQQEFMTGMIEMNLSNSYGLLNGVNVGFGDQDSSESSPKPVQLEFGSIESDSLVNSYYRNFHGLHPFILPRNHLIRVYQDPNKQPSLKPIIAAMRLIGNVYKSREFSMPLKDHVEASCSQLLTTDPFIVQCRLLYSMVLFWHEYKDESKSQMDMAIQTARELGMFQREFAIKHGGQDLVLRENWRRTWWMLYTVDAYYTGTLGTMNFEVANIDATVELPCEESEYELGDIPEPKTLEEFDCREFSPDDIVFSSFAYLISAVRCAAFAISIGPKVSAKEDSPQVLQTADSILNGWMLLLPKEHKQVMSRTGEIDELIFQAHLLIHVATIGLHRPLSDLKFNTVESASSCAREPPLDTPTPDLVNVHTVRVLRSVEAQIRFLALPSRNFHHTPFTTCMVSEGTLALLSACRFLLKGKELTIAREQIRMTIGCLKALAELWSRTARNVREIQKIAHHVLGLGTKTHAGSARNNSHGGLELSSADEYGLFGSETGTSSEDLNMLPSLDSIEDLCGWYNIGGLDPNIPWEN
ncbi:hypothetical protein N7478_001934 [Penicillium angulare]|uniref:uncharacterized protein n=1 Tax=Penicillium angulare TaxID=116970 RepID=UPI00254104BA|nr:uncharacterized protein N7478_001934 [Penicillium angulare]KAJ5288904.1 hypothetical protein N7478_001934 [Penicillium angulare]